MKKENARQDSILGDMKPSRAITRLAVPATLALLAKSTILWIQLTSECLVQILRLQL